MLMQEIACSNYYKNIRLIIEFLDNWIKQMRIIMYIILWHNIE